MTDVRISQLGLEVLGAPTPAVRTSQLGLEVLVPNTPPLCDGPLCVQVNWDASGWPTEWNQPYTNLLSGCLRRVALQRELGYPRIEVDTCTVVAEDATWEVVPGRSASVLAPYLQLGRACRVLALRNGQVYPQFYGEIADYAPEPEGPPWLVTVRVESPLRRLLPLEIDVPLFAVGDWTSNPSDPARSALHAVLDAAAVPAANRALDSKAFPPFRAAWGGERMPVGQALAELAQLGGAFVCVEPRYRDTVAGVNWVLRWHDPVDDLTSAPALTWDATAGDLDGTPRVEFNGEVRW